VARYQLVIQFPEDFFPTHGDLVALEERLIGCLPRTCEVDGHDIGAGTVNFFVYTTAPEAALRAFRKYLGTRKLEARVRIAYREVEGAAFTNLWPRRDPRPFAYCYDAANNPFARGATRVIPKRSPKQPTAAKAHAAKPTTDTESAPAKRLRRQPR
jgi:hypothetical protein